MINRKNLKKGDIVVCRRISAWQFVHTETWRDRRGGYLAKIIDFGHLRVAFDAECNEHKFTEDPYAPFRVLVEVDAEVGMIGVRAGVPLKDVKLDKIKFQQVQQILVTTGSIFPVEGWLKVEEEHLNKAALDQARYERIEMLRAEVADIIPPEELVALMVTGVSLDGFWNKGDRDEDFVFALTGKTVMLTYAEFCDKIGKGRADQVLKRLNEIEDLTSCMHPNMRSRRHR